MSFQVGSHFGAKFKSVCFSSGDIHTVVYNAGNGVFGSYTSITMDKLDMAMKTNVHGLLAVAQNVGPKMEKRGEGVIVVTGATAALRGED